MGVRGSLALNPSLPLIAPLRMRRRAEKDLEAWRKFVGGGMRMPDSPPRIMIDRPADYLGLS